MVAVTDSDKAVQLKATGGKKKGGEGMREDERRKKIYYARINLFET